MPQATANKQWLVAFTETDVIERDRESMQDLAILRGLRDLFKASDLVGSFRFPVRWTQQPFISEYRLDIRHRLPSKEPGLTFEGQMFMGVTVGDGKLVIDHWRDNTGNVNRSMDALWPTFDLADPDCFQQVIDYAREALRANSDQNLRRMLRRRAMR